MIECVVAHFSEKSNYIYNSNFHVVKKEDDNILLELSGRFFLTYTPVMVSVFICFQEYTCPRCESGFIEELLEERR